MKKIQNFIENQSVWICKTLSKVLRSKINTAQRGTTGYLFHQAFSKITVLDISSFAEAKKYQSHNFSFVVHSPVPL